ncbi:hypothetical protein MAIT1_00302 [Magnetofaba australis IT-1]|uniref:Uncharacterized protein n=2 Tax=Magnetofaba TaxID=1472292 RepID=A0A1Y2K8K1_9PROT|nr:hypothetical protein MAIT1_00302 [Magnetofaba australis IT-1]
MEIATNVALSDPSRRLPATHSVMLLEKEPQRAFEYVGRLETRGSEETTDVELLESMRAKAAEIGAHAIIPDPTSKRVLVGEESLMGPTYFRMLRGRAIRYLTDAGN